MRKYLLITVSVLGLAGYAFAQDPAPKPVQTPVPKPTVVPCPAVQIGSPSRTAKRGETIKYAARVNNTVSLSPLQYNWTVSPDTVFAGQGGHEIEFERPSGDILNVRLEVVGLPPHCNRNAAVSTRFNPSPRAFRLDQFIGPLTTISDRQLKRIADVVRRQPTSQLFVVLEYNSDETELAAKQKGQLIASLLSKSQVDVKRINYLLGQTSRERVQFWLVPDGAEVPTIEK